MRDGTALYPELARKVRLPGSSTFAYIGALHRTRSFEADLLKCVPPATNVGHFRLDDERLMLWVSKAERGFVGVVHPDGVAWSPSRVEERLSNLHPAVEEARFRGASFLFVSGRPLTLYPGMVGSSIFVEAEPVKIRSLEENVATEYLRSRGVDDSAIGNVLKFADGQRALVDLFADVELTSVSGNEKRRIAMEGERSLAQSVFSELGPDMATLVESWVYESQLETIEEDDLPSDTLRSALSNSGLMRKVGENTYQLLPFRNRPLWVSALAEWISAVIEPPASWTKVAAELFALERDLRRELATRFESQHGPLWRSDALQHVGADILELARRDAIPATHSLEDLRSPLDWLQLSQLLEMAESLGGPGSFLGLRRTDWQRLAREVLPVRHRVAHMRLVRSGDLNTVRKARQFLEVRRRRQTGDKVPV